MRACRLLGQWKEGENKGKQKCAGGAKGKGEESKDEEAKGCRVKEMNCFLLKLGLEIVLLRG